MVWVKTLIPFASLMFCGGLLVYYRLKKKHKKDRLKSWWEFIEADIVEIGILLMFVALYAPNWLALIFPGD